MWKWTLLYTCAMDEEGEYVSLKWQYEDTEEHYVNIDQFMSSLEVNYGIISIFFYSQYV